MKIVARVTVCNGRVMDILHGMHKSGDVHDRGPNRATVFTWLTETDGVVHVIMYPSTEESWPAGIPTAYW